MRFGEDFVLVHKILPLPYAEFQVSIPWPVRNFPFFYPCSAQYFVLLDKVKMCGLLKVK